MYAILQASALLPTSENALIACRISLIDMHGNAHEHPLHIPGSGVY